MSPPKNPKSKPPLWLMGQPLPVVPTTRSPSVPKSVILSVTVPDELVATLSNATLPITLRQVTDIQKKVPQVTWPVGSSPWGPLWALIANEPPQKLELPLPHDGA